MQKIRYALIGFGGIAENRIAQEGFGCDRSRFNGVEGAELIGAFDIMPQRREAAEKLNLKWYDSVENIWQDPAVDAVYIATNNASHAVLALEAMQHNKHVIVEKPVATTVEDAQNMTAAARAKGLSLTVDHMMVNNVYNIKAAEVIQAGELGTVNDSCFHMEFAFGFTPEEAATWRCSKVEEMGGPIGDVASHCFYMAEFLLQQPIAWVAACYMPKLLPITVEDGACIKFGLADGMTGSVRVSFAEKRGGLAGTLTSNGYEIYGDQAVLRGYCTMTQFSGTPGEVLPIRLEWDNGKEHKDLSVDTPENIYQKLIRQHAASILNNTPDDGSNGLHNLQLCALAHASARQGGVKMLLA